MEPKLTSLAIGKSSMITSVEECALADRLRSLGFTPGSRVTAVMASPMGGDPVAYRIRGTLVALRHTDADRIRVQEGAM